MRPPVPVLLLAVIGCSSRSVPPNDSARTSNPPARSAGPATAAVTAINHSGPENEAYDDSAHKAEEKSRERRPVLRDPSALAQLPPTMRDTLAARGCRIPQWEGDTTANVLRGDFFGQGRNAWAIWCVDADGGTPRILVFHDGSVSSVGDLEGSPTSSGAHMHAYDAKAYAGQRYGCIPDITVFAVSSAMLSGIDATGDTISLADQQMKPHDGILDGDCEGTSNIHYWTGRRWILLAGGD